MRNTDNNSWRKLAALLFGLVVVLLAAPAHAVWYSKDGTIEVRGFLDSATFARDRVGMTKQRFQAQLEFSKDFRPTGFFSEFSLVGTLRASYDAVYDLNDDEFGSKAGGPRSFPAPGNPALFSALTMGMPPFPNPSTNPSYGGAFGPSPPFDGAIPLPGTGWAPPPSPSNIALGSNNPNDGLRFALEDVYGYEDGGVVLATPVRPCDVDSRGCIKGYLDRDTDELRFREFNDDWDWLRELYVDMAIPTFKGRHQLGFRIGRQQVVWGRTDLFRVLDVVNPIDFSRQNLYAEFEDSRIPQGMVNAEYRFGATNLFEDINIQFLWKFEEFRPHDFGQGGEPYSILGAGNLFRALNNCYSNGCTVWNFPGTGVAVDFPSGVIGIRQANVPSTRDEIGARLEGVFKGVGFSLNMLYYYSQFPSLRGGIPATNPFVPPGTPGAFRPEGYPYLIAFDIEFPQLLMIGGSADWYWDKALSSFRVETSYTMDEEFADTLSPRLFSESDVFRWVFGFDRPTFIPFLNKNRAFLISGQIFGQHILDHRTSKFNTSIEDPSIMLPSIANQELGFQDHEYNILLTLLIQGNYLNDRLTPQILTAYDTQARAGVIGPSIEFKPNNNWLFRLGFNIKWTDGSPPTADDNRTANIFPPATCGPATGSPICPLPTGGPAWSSLGLAGLEPLGRFKAGPIGMARNEDEFQLTIRYQF
ncbi:MAG: DUF1302 domain-containing protein [Gammaproteobacteria bacterium]|nr:DUF1302 domain-containing protein [Gammaproteobacteria bacterium]